MTKLEVISDSLDVSASVRAEAVVDNTAVAEMIRAIVASFEQLGVSVHSGSRLHQYARTFAGAAGKVVDEKMHARLDAALMELMQFEAVRRTSADLGQCEGLRDQLSIAVNGRAAATDDRSDCKARSAQFELFLWAAFGAAGLQSRFEEPDLVITIAGGVGELAIAAKRPRSERKLIKHLRAGCRQIASAGREGIVAIDLTFAESISKPLYIEEIAQHQIAAQIVLDGYVSERREEIVAALAGHHVVGALFHYGCPVRTVREPTRFVSRRWLFLQTQPEPINMRVSAMMTQLQQLGRVGRQRS